MNTQLDDLTIREFLEKLASKKPTPGGGSAAALAGAIAAALVAMAAKTAGNQKIATRAERLMGVLNRLIKRDADAFESVLKKEPSLEEALKLATEVPLETARYSHEVSKLADVLAEDCGTAVIIDLGIAVMMARAAIESAILNVEFNLHSIKDEKLKKEIKKAAEALFKPVIVS